MTGPAGSDGNALLKASLMRQFDTAWQLASYHLDTLSDEECLWRPAATGPHIHQQPDGSWLADWPVDEAYEAGPPSIGWISWHMVFWWSMVSDHTFGDATLRREDIPWPGSAHDLRATLTELHTAWVRLIRALEPAGLAETARTRWPFAGRPLADVIGWVTLELTKNAAEIGYLRFLYASRQPPS